MKQVPEALKLAPKALELVPKALSVVPKTIQQAVLLPHDTPSPHGSGTGTLQYNNSGTTDFRLPVYVSSTAESHSIHCFLLLPQSIINQFSLTLIIIISIIFLHVITKKQQQQL